MIGTSFVIPGAPQWLTPPVVGLIVLSQILALVAGVWRLAKRIRTPKLRLISSPDDYFGLTVTNVLFVLCALAVLHTSVAFEAYFVVIAFVIAYVPFSKISHYLYYPIARYFYGSYLGRRGVVR
jgi:nitrate reductase gamma subunit